MKTGKLASIVALLSLLGSSAQAAVLDSTEASLRAAVETVTSQLESIPGMQQASAPCSAETPRTPASIPVLASSGQESSGGGDVVICGSGPLGWYFSNKTFLADTFGLAIQGAIPNEIGLTEDVYLDTALATLRSRDPEAAAKIEARLKSLKFVPVNKLPELEDDNIDLAALDQLSGKYCKKRQLAIQNLRTGEVKYDWGYLNALSEPERALFKIHEAYIAERKQSNDTTLIRKEVEGIANDGSFASFLADTIYQRRMIPKFRPVRVQELVTALYMASSARGFTNDSFEEFLDPRKSDFKYLMNLPERMMRDHRGFILAVDLRKHYRLDRMTDDMIMAAFQQSNDPLEFAENLDRMYGQTWTVRDTVDEKDLEKAVNFLAKARPYREERLQKELQEYLQKLKAGK